VKSRRGAPKRIPTEGFACPNQRCTYYGITAGYGLLWAAEYRFYRTGESDRASWRLRSGTPYMGHFPTGPTAAGSSRMVASLLSFCAPSRIAAGSAHTASRTRGQPSGATLPATDICHGSRQNHPAMDDARGALVPIAKGFGLRGIETRGGCSGMPQGEELGWSLTPRRGDLSGLPHHKIPARNGFGEGSSNYPPYPMAVPLLLYPPGAR